jgi:O-acetyl-ADP-ribose deacetylase (regulator of RNase III)
MPTTFNAIKGNIAYVVCDVIVCPTDVTLVGGEVGFNAIAAAIHSAAGSGLRGECMGIREVAEGVRCPVGEVRITSAHLLPCRHVVHAVGPTFDVESVLQSDHALSATYTAIMRAASLRACSHIAIPAMWDTPENGYAMQRAAQLAVVTVKHATRTLLGFEKVTFVCSNEPQLMMYEHMLRSST